MGVTCEGVAYWPFSNTDPRMRVKFRVCDERLGVDTQLPFIVDSGATAVALPVSVLHLGSQACEKIIEYGDVCEHIGLSEHIRVKYYRWCLSEFRVGQNIVLRDFPVHVTFDEHVNMCLVGMSFLKLFNIFIQPQHRTIMFAALPLTERIVTGKESAEHIERLRVPYIGVDEVSDEEPVDGIDRPEFGVQGFKLT